MKKDIEKVCYKQWLKSPKTWNHYLASQLLKKKLYANNKKML